MHPITIETSSVGSVSCQSGDFHADAHDVAQIQSVLADAAMHAMATGHTVIEHVSRDMTVRPSP